MPDEDDAEDLSLESFPNNEDEEEKGEEKEEYDPSHPLTSSDDDEVADIPQPKSPPPTKPPPETQRGKLRTESPALNLASIPVPNEEYRRPTIQFSIPTRHRIFSMGSLIKRNKGLVRKEVKSGSSISFQTEMSKAFGTEKEEEEEGEEGGQVEKEGEGERVSLVAEIFGSDEEEEEGTRVSEPLSTVPLDPDPLPEPILPAAETARDGVLDSAKWKKVVKDIEPPLPAPLLDDDVVLICEEPPEVQIIETPPTEPEDDLRSDERRRERRSRKAAVVVEVEPRTEPEAKEVASERNPSSLDSISEEDGPEMDNLKKKDGEKRTEENVATVKTATSFNIMDFDPDKPSPKDKSPKKDKEKKASKRKKSFSNESNCEEGEILDVAEKKRKKGKKSKKSKKRKRSSKDSRSPSPVEFTERKVPAGPRAVGSSSSSDDEDDESKRVSWKKPSKLTKERNYR
jgi:hypothetical protein